MAKYETKFRPGEMVTTLFGKVGVVSAIIINEHFLRYTVKLDGIGPSYINFSEEELTPHDPAATE